MAMAGGGDAGDDGGDGGEVGPGLRAAKKTRRGARKKKTSDGSAAGAVRVAAAGIEAGR